MKAARAFSLVAVLAPLASPLLAQDPGFGPGGPPGMGGPGRGPMNQTIAVRDRFDHDGNGRLDAEERREARAWLKENRQQRGRGPGGGPGGPGFGPPPGEETADANQPKEPRRVQPKDVASYADRDLFDPDVVRTFFFEFPQNDWYEELTDFYRTDVDVPGTITVDGVRYENVGVGFRGNTSFSMVQSRKKSIDLAFDHLDPKQTLRGLHNLDLLNSHDDPSMLREAIHGFVANRFFPAPRVCLVRVVINGQDHGIYAAVQQFDKGFLDDHFGTKKGDRFKIPPDFSGAGGLRWLGDDPKDYARNYQLKSEGNEANAWAGLVDLCSVLERTAIEDLPRVLPQHADVSAMLWFLAMDNAVADDDGYFSRASDYLLWRDPHGRFHAIPRDNNEILLGARGGPGGGPSGRPGGGPPGGPGGQGPGGQGPGGRRGPGGPGGGTASTPLAGASREDRPLLHRLLEVPAWRERYLANLRTIATTVFTDDDLGARIEKWRTMIDDVAAHEAYSLYGYAAFQRSFARDGNGKPAAGSIMAVVAQRRDAILKDPAMQGAWPELRALEANAKVAADGTHVLTVAVTARGAKPSAVRLHHGTGRFGDWTTIEMTAAGDRWTAALPGVANGTHVRYWVEAIAAEAPHHVACLPAGNGALPATWRAPKADETKADAKKK